MCALGEDISQEQIDYWHNGKLEKRNLSFSLRQTFQVLLNRMSGLHIYFFPFLAEYFLTPAEWDIKANAKILRDKISQIASRRLEAMKSDPSLKEKGDFLTIMLTDELFKDNN